jgi:hypothetical protein
MTTDRKLMSSPVSPSSLLYCRKLSSSFDLEQTPVQLISITGMSPNPYRDKTDIRRNKTFAYLLSILLPHLPGLFPSSLAQKAAFGPGAYLVGNGVERLNQDMERREAEVWGLAAA